VKVARLVSLGYIEALARVALSNKDNSLELDLYTLSPLAGG
jgi:hypothetical protein